MRYPLPSDCRYRNDRMLLKKGDLERASEEKVKGEMAMRKDRALRAEFVEKNK